MNDLRYALRSLRSHPGFTSIAVLTLALGIGAGTSVFSVVEGTLLRSLPFPHADRLVDLKTTREEWRAQRPGGGTSSLTAYQAWSADQVAIEDMAAYLSSQPVFTGSGEAVRVQAWTVTANFFAMYGAAPLLGRTFLPEEDRPGASPVAILSHRFWASAFGNDPEVLGRGITLDTTTYTVVGVMPRGFEYPALPLAFRRGPHTDVWLALGSLLSGPSGAQWAQRRAWWIVARLRPGFSPLEAQARLDAVSRQWWEGDPRNTGLVPYVESLHAHLIGDVGKPLLLMLGAVTLVLLVACANVASLLLSRAAARGSEMAVRLALGAGRGRLVRQLLTESLAVALAAGGLGLLFTFWAVPYLVARAGPELPGVASIGVNHWVLAMCLGTSILAGVLSGLVPALQLSRAAVAEALKTGGGPGSVLRRGRTRANDASLVLQSALTLVLLSGAGLLAMSFARLVRLDPGFETEHVVAAELRLPDTRYRNSGERTAFVQAILEQARALPGASAVALASGIPMSGGSLGTVAVPGSAEQSQTVAWFMGITPDYFRVMGVPLLRGSVPDESASLGALRFAIDEAAARAYFPGQDPLGKRLTIYGRETGTVVGVVGDTKQESLDAPPPPHVYYSLAPGSYLKVVARTSGDPAQLAGPLREAIRRVDSGVPIDRIATMKELLSESLTRQRFYGLLLAVFAGCALALAAAGMFGAASYAVAQRTRELGLRIALGAKPAAVVSLIVGRGLRLALVGIVLGLLGAAAATRLLRGFLFEVEPTDPWVLTTVGCLLAAVVLVASWLPARRAANVDPMVALRYE